MTYKHLTLDHILNILKQLVLYTGTNYKGKLRYFNLIILSSFIKFSLRCNQARYLHEMVIQNMLRTHEGK